MQETIGITRSIDEKRLTLTLTTACVLLYLSSYVIRDDPNRWKREGDIE